MYMFHKLILKLAMQWQHSPLAQYRLHVLFRVSTTPEPGWTATTAGCWRVDWPPLSCRPPPTPTHAHKRTNALSMQPTGISYHWYLNMYINDRFNLLSCIRHFISRDLLCTIYTAYSLSGRLHLVDKFWFHSVFDQLKIPVNNESSCDMCMSYVNTV